MTDAEQEELFRFMTLQCTNRLVTLIREVAESPAMYELSAREAMLVFANDLEAAGGDWRGTVQ